MAHPRSLCDALMIGLETTLKSLYEKRRERGYGDHVLAVQA